ncbi:MAG: cobalamin synthase [Bryobacterales bacterium]|nr:cobalamin synthase [Bryobacterales bacterium]
MIDRFLAGLQFLTVLPIPGKTASPGRAAVFFPLTGALLGASGGAVFYASRAAFGVSVASLLTIAWLVVITGCLHEDGLADVADAFRAGRSREKILLILKDSRIGTYGAVALIVSLGVRWQALADCRTNPIYGLIAALTLSRTAMVALGCFAPTAGEGLGREFVNGLSGNVGGLAMVQGLLTAFLVGWRYAAPLLLSTIFIVLLARMYFVRRLGGVTGDCLGATCQIVETVNLVILSCRYSS